MQERTRKEDGKDFGEVVQTSFGLMDYSFYVETSEIMNNGLVSFRQSIFLRGCSNPNPEEVKFARKKISIYTHSREWLVGIESPDYSERVHSQLVESIKNFPGNYLFKVRKIPHDKKF